MDGTERHQVELLFSVFHRYHADFIYDLTTDGMNTLYFLTNSLRPLNSVAELNQIEIISKKIQIIRVRRGGVDEFENCYKLHFSQEALYFLEYFKNHQISKFPLSGLPVDQSLEPTCQLTSYMDYSLEGVCQLLLDNEGAVIITNKNCLVKINSEGSFTLDLKVERFCLDPEGNVVVVHGKKVSKVSKDFKKVEVLGGSLSGYVDGPLNIAGFCNLREVCCDEYGTIFVVDCTDPGEIPKIRMIEDGWVSTIHYEMEMGFSKVFKQEISEMCVVGKYLVGVWNGQQIFRMEFEERYNNKWPKSHKKFENKKQQIVEEFWMTIGMYGIPKELAVYCVQTLLSLKK